MIFQFRKIIKKDEDNGRRFLLYATINTVGLAKEAITMLEVKHKEDDSLIKRHLIDMFDVMKSQELYENFVQKFKQLHTETVTGFYIKYQSYVNKLISRNIWIDDAHMSFNEVSFFRAKLKSDISTQLTLLLQQNLIDYTDVTLEKAYKFALLAEKMVPKQSSLTAAATVQSRSYSRNGTACFYCGQPGHVIKDCTQKKRNRKPCKNT